MWGRLSALFLLALGLVKTLLTRTLRGPALQGFAERYGREGIHAVTQDEARLLSEAGPCIACGRCDRYEGARVAELPHYGGMMQFVLAGLRSLPDYDATARSIEGVPFEAFAAAQRECPVDVPLERLAKMVRRRGS